jgi:GT2 family glycosyltransferase/tetratricopeptide (TPR) repeat protein/glycosyltransferase involved in cell wall biosynthesis/2-polyprenyl-3-methyl-5-hydroxy-6-metoxy-1,4-benzoquinol methylase
LRTRIGETSLKRLPTTRSTTNMRGKMASEKTSEIVRDKEHNHKKFPSRTKYDVCYVLFDTSKWGGVKGTLVQINGLVDRGYRVCLVSKSGPPDWFDLKGDSILSPDLSVDDIPESDIVIGTWWPTILIVYNSNKGISVHYCRGYEAQSSNISDTSKEQIKGIYRLQTIKIANSTHIARFIRDQFGQEAYIVRNDIDHGIFYPRKESVKLRTNNKWRILVIGPYEIAWKGVKDCLASCDLLKKDGRFMIELVRASQTQMTKEEKLFADKFGDNYTYHYNLSEEEMSVLYNSCDLLITGSYPDVESFGRPAMEALACGIPAIVTDIPAYRDYDPIHDYALFVKVGDFEAMANAARKIMGDEALRARLIRRGIEVSSHYSIQKALDDLELVLSDIYCKYSTDSTMQNKDERYYAFTRPEIQALVRPDSRKILDVGCASGELGYELKKSRPRTEVWGIEIVPEIADKAKRKLDRVLKGNVANIVHALPDNYFSTIIFADVLEHMDDPNDILDNIKSKLAPLGEVIASIPNVRHWSVLKDLIEGKWDYQDAGILDRDHRRFFTKKSIVELFNKAGYSIIEMQTTMLPGVKISREALNALSRTTLDISTLEEESSHYQYLIKAKANINPRSLISIVILTFNQLKYTKKCVKSISTSTPEQHEIIFVDNGSTDGTVKWLRHLAKDNSRYIVIENSKNLGFAKGCNQGIEAAHGQYILLLNNDVVVTEGWLSGLLECLWSSCDIGIVGPMTNNISGPQRVRHVGYDSIKELDAYARKFREQNRHRRVPQRRIVGFCMLFRRELAEKIGLLDESFGTGNFEDDDYCLRASLEGFQNIIAGDVIIHHYGSRSFIGNGIDYGSTMTGHRKIFAEKWRINSASALGKRLMTLSALENADELSQQGEVDKAVEKLIEAIGKEPENIKIYHKLAGILMEAKRFQESLDVVKSMPDEARGSIETAVLTGYCEEGLGRHLEAEEHTDLVTEKESGNAPALNLKGMLAYRRDDRKAAEECFKKATESDPGYGEPYTNLGVLQWSIGEREAGISLLEKGFILSPRVMDNATMYHAALCEMRAFERGEQIFRDAKGIYPQNQRVAFLLIDLLMQQGKERTAMEEIEEAMTRFTVDDGLLAAALAVREKVGAEEIDGYRKKGTLSLSMIVKNEEQHISRCIMSVKPIVNEMIIVDTGSTDRTKNIAKALGAKIYDFEWTGDFSEARNYSLSKAYGEWILSLDADEVISARDHHAIKEIVRKGRPAAYKIFTRNYSTQVGAQGFTPNTGEYPAEEAGLGWFPSGKVRLFPNDDHIRFENPVHEFVERTVTKAGIPIKACDIPVHHYGRLDMEKVREKGEAYYLLGMKKLEEKGASDLKALFELGVQAGELKKYKEAAELFEKLVGLDPNYPLALFNLGFAYLELGRYQEALEYSKRAFETDPSKKECVVNYAHCEVVAGDIKKGISLLEEALRKTPEYPPAMAILASAYAIEGKKHAGIEIIKNLQAKRFNCANCLHEIADGLFISGRYQQTMTLYELIVQTRQLHEDTRERIDRCYEAMCKAGMM